ncbi:MAG: putative exported protein [Candidatus Moranbacteria bacterium GW2011_GWC2_37_73]|nr:MAG: hypothetical protein UR95_C0004G0075 [Parcubacteria group bacterium GW2011_GWC1_36_108]KKQ00582.1 MAG: putative exported protein [Candidatus Moranbacteria bacterium GW2011_GWD1_36_198]KKQ02035.1 MAG: putative exported protein [Candidatus Moranbacteria bacterium GW2011_GWD2_36_198]KKQ39892.1 MAG: putative exported protein [Candidatus Moranbacteria bacterium GW2011_GWC2_37_73]HAS00219.1 hypothetical protein [Candidatus Moranbacteria bacterium]
MNKEKKQGSILAYSLVIISVMIAIAGTLSVVAIVEKKGASGTEFSMQSLQTADSGVQLALKKLSNQGTISTVFTGFGTGCSDGKVTGTDVGPSGSSYELTFFNTSGTALGCSADKNEIANIKSVGTYNNTVRAVNVAVAATAGTGYALSCFLGSAANQLICCRTDNATGETKCKDGGPNFNNSSHWEDLGNTSGDTGSTFQVWAAN